MRSSTGFIAGALAALAGAPHLVAQDAAGDRLPNLVLILADDAGYADFGFQGSREVPSPRLDDLCDEGVRFSQAYVSASVCSPSRAGLLTGRYQQRFGHEFNLPRQPEEGYRVEDSGLALDEQTLADRFKEVGYRTGVIGKWHLGFAPHFRPLQRGFDEFFGFLFGSRSYHPIAGNPGRGLMLRDGEEVVSEEGYMTDRLAHEAAQFVRARGDEPFFLYVAFSAVHTPMHALPADIEAVPKTEDEKRRILAAMTLALDRGVGTILDALDEMGTAEDSLVVFLNDNGGAESNSSSNGSLRGMKGSHFEGGLRVPMILRWPGKVPAGAQFDDPVSALDLGATFLRASGLAVPDELDGVDLLPFLCGARSERPHERLFWRRGPLASVREGDWKLIRIEGHDPLLFDLAADPSETEDLAPGDATRVAALLAQIQSWEKGLSAPRWRTAAPWQKKQIKAHLPLSPRHRKRMEREDGRKGVGDDGD